MQQMRLSFANPSTVISVVLVACGASKLANAARARELYTGNLFRAARAYAEANGGPWQILSARYGLVDPDRILAPYNQKLTPRWAREGQWGQNVANAIVSKYLVNPETMQLRKGVTLRITMLAPELYADEVSGALPPELATIVRPLGGLGIGRQLSWFKHARIAA